MLLPLKLGVWSVMRTLKIDELILAKTHRGSFFRKLLPRSKAYKHEQFEFPVSPKLKIIIDRGDYTQWRVFTGKLFINPQIFDHLTIHSDTFTMIDIGANIGAFSILFAEKVKVKEFALHLFEPNPGVTSTLQENIKRLKSSNASIKAVVNEFAVGEKEAVLTLKIDDQHTGLATLGESESYNRTIDVRVISLDDYIETHKITRIDFLKIDVESFEPSILSGARKTLTNLKPVLYFEYSSEWFDNFSDEFIVELITYLSSMGYKFYRESLEGKLFELPMSVADLKKYRHLNVLAACKH